MTSGDQKLPVMKCITQFFYFCSIHALKTPYKSEPKFGQRTRKPHSSTLSPSDEEVEYQLLPLPAAIINLPGRSSTAIQELCFEAENIPPLGYTAFFISPVRAQLEENEFNKKRNVEQAEPDQEIIPLISNEYLKVAVDKNTGLLESIAHVDGFKVQVSQNFYYYSQSQQPLQSGAYAFRPEKQRPVPVSEKVSFNTIRGSLVKEIRQRFSDWITQIIRLYRGEEYVELEWIIGPVPIGADLGKEVVSLFTANITSNGYFYTDSNSRQMMKRTCWNETASHQQKKQIAACYYPVSSRICIQSFNGSVGMCVLTDRTQGGSSYNDGEIELMVHRRLLTDDGFGLEETLNEEAHGVGLVIRGKHRLHFGNYKQEVDDLNFSERMSQSARKWMYEPWLFFTSGEKLNRRKWQNVRNKRFSALRGRGLPRHIHILTLEPWKAGSVLLRLENTLDNPVRDRFKSEKGEDLEEYQSKASFITVELRKIFLHMTIKMVRETTLAANQWLDDARQMDWSTRYVYPGADDGILPEDIEDIKEKPLKQTDDQDDAHFSDEEQEVTRRKALHRQKSNSKQRLKLKGRYEDREREYERKKRSVDITENIMENIINDTGINYKDNETNTTIDEDTAFERPTPKRNVSAKVDKYYGIQITQKTPRLNFFNRRKPNNWAQDFGTEDGVSSEEDFSSNKKKISMKKRNEFTTVKRRKEDEIAVVDIDDGVTKSMYDMYYRRPKPQTQPRKETHIRGSREENSMKRKMSRRRPATARFEYYDEATEQTTRVYRKYNKKRKSLTEEAPFMFKVPARRNKGSQKKGRQKIEIDDVLKETVRSWTPRTRRKDDSGMETDYSEEEEMDGWEKEVADVRAENYRRKRTLAKKDEHTQTSSEFEDPEFVVTLRPTQIRTFVIWFDTNKAYKD